MLPQQEGSTKVVLRQLVAGLASPQVGLKGRLVESPSSIASRAQQNGSTPSAKVDMC